MKTENKDKKEELLSDIDQVLKEEKIHVYTTVTTDTEDPSSLPVRSQQGEGVSVEGKFFPMEDKELAKSIAYAWKCLLVRFPGTPPDAFRVYQSKEGDLLLRPFLVPSDVVMLGNSIQDAMPEIVMKTLRHQSSGNKAEVQYVERNRVDFNRHPDSSDTPSGKVQKIITSNDGGSDITMKNSFSE